MCAIAAVLGWAGGREALHDIVLRMTAAMAHRGPDAAGIWISPDATVALGHRRLAILDPTGASRQPIWSPGQDWVVTFNGEIYNHRELRRDHGLDDLVTSGDSEVLAAMIARFGSGAVDRLRGMFAFVACSGDARRVVIARDALGIKPLYVAERSGVTVIASEVRGILASGLVESAIDHEALAGFLTWGTPREPLTMVRGVRAFPSGTVEEGSPTGSRVRSTWWRVPTGGPPVSDPAAVVREAFDVSMRRHVVSDVPVGVFLSGGIDSFLVARAVAASGPLQTFCLRTGGGNDESSDAARSAAAIGSRHSEIDVSGTLATSFQDFLNAQDQPSLDGWNVFLVSRGARAGGMKVCLSGLGADELFGGYGMAERVRLWARRARWGRFGSVLGPTVARLATDPRLRRVGDWVVSRDVVEAAWQLVRSIDGGHGCTATRFPRLAETESLPRRVALLEYEGYLKNQLLRDADVMSMAHGLELRVPFVDRDFLEMVSGLPDGVRFREGKATLIDALGGVPEHLRNRAKRGFLLPVDGAIPTGALHLPRSIVRTNHRGNARVAIVSLSSWIQRHRIAL